MITENEYLKAKKIVEEYEEQEFTDGMNNAMFCANCQALNPQDCMCDEEEDEDDSCSMCCGTNRKHAIECPYNIDPYDNLLRNGYD